MSDQKATQRERMEMFAAGMKTAADIMLRMAAEPSIAVVGGPAALRVVENAIRLAAEEQREKARAR